MSEVITLADGSVLDVARFPLPDGLTDGVLNWVQLAGAFRVSENTISKWMLQGMPVQTEGQNGVSYEFRLSHCHAWRMQRDAAAREAKARGDQLAQQAAMAFLNLHEDEADSRIGMTAADVIQWAEAEYRRNRVDEQRRDLVRAGQMRELCEDLLNTVRSTISTMPDYCEREFGLSASDVAKLEAQCDSLLSEMMRRIEAELLAPAQVIDLATARPQMELNL